MTHLNKDFSDFSKSKNFSPHQKENREILDLVRRDLSISHKKVFTKLLIIQSFIGILTLTFCPQFSLSLTNNHDLFHFFHHNFGEEICMFICGSIFIGCGALTAPLLLKLEEIKKIKDSNFLYFMSVSILALAFFLVLGPNIYLSLSLFWLLGASIGGVIFFNLGSLLKKVIFKFS